MPWWSLVAWWWSWVLWWSLPSWWWSWRRCGGGGCGRRGDVVLDVVAFLLTRRQTRLASRPGGSGGRVGPPFERPIEETYKLGPINSDRSYLFRRRTRSHLKKVSGLLSLAATRRKKVSGLLSVSCAAPTAFQTLPADPQTHVRLPLSTPPCHPR